MTSGAAFGSPAQGSGRAGLHAEIAFSRGDFTLEAVLDVPEKSVLAVLGPNGSGKTTVLRLLAGLLALERGRLEVTDTGGATECWDDPATGLFTPAEDRACALVFQDYRLFPHLSVLDNVAFPARARGLRRGESRQQAEVLLDRLGLTALAGRRPPQLSGGQAQRVALARALACEPRVLLLDEPLAALDARTRLEVRSELRNRLHDFAGVALLVTHDPLEAMVLADRICVLEHGRVVQFGTPAEVARRPLTEYVARLVGLNLYSGGLGGQSRVTLDGGGTLVTAGGEESTGGEQSTAPLHEGGRVLVALPPSAITLHPQAPLTASARNTWQGEVTGLELLTDRVRVAVSGAPDALVDITPAALAELELVVGQQVWLTAKATEVIAYPEPAGRDER